MKILILTRYANLGASSRLRTFQYIPYFEKAGFEITVSPLLNDDYLEVLYSDRKYSFLKILSRYINRIVVLIRCSKYNLIIIEKELFPWLPSFAERILCFFKKPYVVDFDDAIFHNYDKNENKIIRWLLKNKISAVMRNSSVVIAGNSYIGEYALQSGAKQIEFLPTVIDLKRYNVINKERKSEFVIGWIGSPSTAKYLKLVESALLEIAKKLPIKLVMIGAKSQYLGTLKVETKEWYENTEVQDIQSFDIGIMPLIDDYWERGKCGYKIIQYMACGKPVIASPVGTNNEIINHGIDGYLAHTVSDWIKYIETLASQPELCIKLGEAGRKKIESFYCKQVTADKFIEILNNALKK